MNTRRLAVALAGSLALNVAFVAGFILVTANAGTPSPARPVGESAPFQLGLEEAQEELYHEISASLQASLARRDRRISELRTRFWSEFDAASPSETALDQILAELAESRLEHDRAVAAGAIQLLQELSPDQRMRFRALLHRSYPTAALRYPPAATPPGLR